MPFYPAPTLHGLMLVFGTQKAVDIWNAIDQKELTRSAVVPLPSWWHLPSDAVTVALALLLLQYGADPPRSVDALLQPQLACRDSCNDSDGTPIRIYGFSAGSYSGIFAHRVLTEKEHALKCTFESGILGAICFHPILLYDFSGGRTTPLSSQLTRVLTTRLDKARNSGGQSCFTAQTTPYVFGSLHRMRRRD
jgi:hypothetical protein